MVHDGYLLGGDGRHVYVLLVDGSQRYAIVMCWHVTAEYGTKWLSIRTERYDICIVSRRWYNT